MIFICFWWLSASVILTYSYNENQAINLFSPNEDFTCQFTGEKHTKLEHFHISKTVIHMRNKSIQHFPCEIFVHINSILNVKMEGSLMKIQYIREISICEILGEIFVMVGPSELNKMTY